MHSMSIEVNKKFMASLKKLVKNKEKDKIIEDLKLETSPSKDIYKLRCDITEIAVDAWKAEDLVYFWSIIDDKYYRRVNKESFEETGLSDLKKTSKKKSKK